MFTIGMILSNLFLGFAYDVLGRKIPIMIVFGAAIIGEFMLPFVHSIPAFYFAGMLGMFVPVITGNPFVPDLIMEQSQGLANMLRGNCSVLATLFVLFLYLLFKSGKHCFNQNVIFIFLAFLMIGTFLFLRLKMKDIVDERI